MCQKYVTTILQDLDPCLTSKKNQNLNFQIFSNPYSNHQLQTHTSNKTKNPTGVFSNLLHTCHLKHAKAIFSR